MTGSGILDLMIAMAMFYFALSMVCSTLNDVIARFGEWRARNLEAAIRSLLLNGRDSQNNELLDRFYTHPLIQTLIRQADLGVPGWFKSLRTWPLRLGSRLLNAGRALIGSPSTTPAIVAAPPADGKTFHPTTRLQSIPTSTFVQALLEIVKPADWTSTKPIAFDDYWRIVGRLPDGPLKDVLRSLAEEAGETIDGVRAQLAKWFDQTMEQATEWFRRTMRLTSIVVAAVFCTLFNIDSIEVSNKFYTDGALRGAFVAMAAEEAKKPAGEQRKLEEDARTIFKLELGWGKLGSTWPDRWKNLFDKVSLLKVIGLLITVVAISMGAPFWHDLITNLVKRKMGASAAPPSPTAK